jgi:hypothetical protein
MQHGIERTFAAIGDRTKMQVGVWYCLQDAAADGIGHLARS